MPPMSAPDFYIEIYHIVNHLNSHPIKQWELLNSLLSEILRYTTQKSPIPLSGNRAKLHFLLQQETIKNTDYHKFEKLRYLLYHSEKLTNNRAKQWLLPCAKQLAQLWEILSTIKIPDYLQQLFPSPIPEFCIPKFNTLVRRVIVNSILADTFTVTSFDSENTHAKSVRFINDEMGTHIQRLLPLLHIGTQLNLLEIEEDKNNIITTYVVVEPDYLIDVSALSQCFQSYATSSHLYTLNRLLPTTQSQALILGNFASQLLDETIHNNQTSYSQSIRHFFQKNALSFTACKALQSPTARQAFHTEARTQQIHLQEIVQNQFPKALCIRTSEELILEPSFFCEALGLQGRMDLITTDLHHVIEQKSGKKDFFSGRAQRTHSVQMQLYLAILRYNQQLSYENLSAHLLYSKYKSPESLLRHENDPSLLSSALQLRNEIVAREFRFAQGQQEYFEELTLDQINQTPSTIWQRFKAPKLQKLLDHIQKAPDLSKAYFYRFYHFLALEHQLAKLGSSQREASGFAAAWHATLAEKRQAGNILYNLSLDHKTFTQNTHEGIKQLYLLITPSIDTSIYTPNFRAGDIVLLYAYPRNQKPDLRKGFVFRATITHIDKLHITLELRAPQTNPKAFQQIPTHHLYETTFLSKADISWAIEPDFMESGMSGLFRGLFHFLTGNSRRRQLLLQECPAEIDPTRTAQLKHVTPEAQLLASKSQQIRDLLLLIGPPGTGKTSIGLMSILHEELSYPKTQVLLSAFTNRAVDEICSKLVQAQLNFLRIGKRHNCAHPYHNYLLENNIQQCSTLDAVTKLLQDTRIIVGTTASLTAQLSSLSAKRFSLAIIDEASQLLEPHLLPFFMAELPHTNQPLIERFVLIGDHKQLPAVVQQRKEDSHVQVPALQKIGLKDCRNSLFERMLHLVPESCIHRFTKQGRMHPEVAAFANRHFYNSTLAPIPLPHQLIPSLHPRVQFFHCPPSETHSVSSKTNLSEALLITQLANEEWNILQKRNQQFDIQKDLGIIVPYRHQISLIRQQLLLSSHPELAEITIDTVERFQGTEREVIIYGFTITQPQQLSFLCDSQFIDENNQLIDRKLNVVLTRARERTLLVGNIELLVQHPLFSTLIHEISSSPPNNNYAITQ